MKKVIFILGIFISTGILFGVSAQTQFSSQPDTKTRKVHFFIFGLELPNDADTLIERLQQFPDNILEISVDLPTQMCSLVVKEAKDDYLERIIFYLGFKALKKEELPPNGFKYVFNPDGTWKLKAL